MVAFERQQVGLAGDVADQAEDRFDRLDVAGQGLADLDRLLGLAAGLGRDTCGDFDFGPGILDRADQARRGLRRLAHRHRRLLGRSRDFAGLAQHAAGGGAGLDRLAAEILALAGAILDDAHHPAVERAGLARLGLLAFLAGDGDRVMDERVDLDRLDFRQGAGKANLLRLIADLAAQGGIGGFGFGIDADQQRRQGQAGAERARDIGLRLTGPFGMIEAFELGGDERDDATGQLLDLGVVEAVVHLGRLGVAAPEFARHFLGVAGNDLPQLAGALGQVAARVVQAKAPRQIIIAVRRTLHHIRHWTLNPTARHCFRVRYAVQWLRAG